jgi:hypothetical protein
MMNDLAKEVVVDAIRAYAESRLDQFLANTADGDASPPKWVTDIVGFDVVDRPAFLAGVQTMCDGSPAAKMIKGAADRVWNSMGPWHLQKESMSCLCKLFDEVFYSDVVSSFRGEGLANEARRQWHMQMKGMRQGVDEMLQFGLAFLTALAMEFAEETKCDPSTITPAELDGQQLKLAAESELIFEMVAFIRLRNAYFGIVDSKNTGEFGNFSLYLELLPIMQRIFVATNATSYVLLVNAEIERWLVASDNERKVHEVRALSRYRRRERANCSGTRQSSMFKVSHAALWGTTITQATSIKLRGWDSTWRFFLRLRPDAADPQSARLWELQPPRTRRGSTGK